MPGCSSAWPVHAPDVHSMRLRDPTGMAKEMANDGVTWGKRSARTWRLAGRKESMIGEVMRQLADGEKPVSHQRALVSPVPGPLTGGP
jgi:hypothetical protein